MYALPVVSLGGLTAVAVHTRFSGAHAFEQLRPVPASVARLLHPRIGLAAAAVRRALSCGERASVTDAGRILCVLAVPAFGLRASRIGENMKRHHRAILAVLRVGVLAGASIGHAFAATHDPADASAPVLQLIYESPFTDYRVLGEDKKIPWQDANEKVGTIGGWRAYAREAAAAIKAHEAANAMLTPATVEAVKAKPAASRQLPAIPTPTPGQTHKDGG